MRQKVTRIGLLAIALSVTPLFITLRMWQLDRAEQKRTTSEEFERLGHASQVDLNQPSVDDGSALPGYRTAATGRYIGASILLDNQVHRGHARVRCAKDQPAANGPIEPAAPRRFAS